MYKANGWEHLAENEKMGSVVKFPLAFISATTLSSAAGKCIRMLYFLLANAHDISTTSEALNSVTSVYHES